ncbi:cation transport protein-domain-containing protein [Blakeslea trispora]|nr:cation transport protein-domain-containing protein [Blakeslea trispora]
MFLIRLWDFLKHVYEERVHFLQLHYIYILLLALLASCCFYLETNTHWSYIDALFMAITSVTNTGLATIDMSQLSYWQLIVMCFSSFLGSHIIISIIIVYTRRYYFSKRFEDILAFNHTQQLREINKRKFEKAVQELERQQQRRSLDHRHSFLSTHSLSNRKQGDEETMPNTIASTIKRNFLSSRPFLTTSLTSLDLKSLSNKKRNASLDTVHFTKSDIQNLKQTAHSRSSPNVNTDTDAYSMEWKKPRSDQQNDTGYLHPHDTPLDKTIPQKDSIDITIQQPSVSNSGSDHHDGNPTESTSVNNQAIVFAQNIDRQREMARRRLEQDRQFEEALQQITGETDSEMAAYNRFSSDQTTTGAHSKSQLTRQQRYRLGGAEYRALELLTIIVPCFYFFFVIGFGFLIRIYIASSSFAQGVLEASTIKGASINSWFFSFFLSLSSFNNLGLSVLDTSMISFQTSPCILILCMILVLAGNTAYAIFLRLTIWILYQLTPRTYVMRREALLYLLNHPRRCYTTLFPATQTKWLLIVLVGITTVEFVCFIALNYSLPILQHISWDIRILDSLFQSVATRNAGFSIVDLNLLNPAIQIVFIVAMYISVYPVAISMRNSNVYQERALGIYKGIDDDMYDHEHQLKGLNSDYTLDYSHKLKRHSTMTSIVANSKKVLQGPDFFVMTQIQRQLTSEICWVICCIFAICVIEAEAIAAASPISIASIIYECVSAFGNVGASIGYPNTTASQAQQYHPLSKLILIVLMYRGRHRGLPATIDRAVLLPSEQLEEKELEDNTFKRRNTSFSINDGLGESFVFYNRSRTL